MNLGDIVFYRDEAHGHHRFWEVCSVCLGGVGQESLIELRNLLEVPGNTTDGRHGPTTWVPEVMLRQMQIYTHPHIYAEREKMRLEAEQRSHAAEAQLAYYRGRSAGA